VKARSLSSCSFVRVREICCLHNGLDQSIIWNLQELKIHCTKCSPNLLKLTAKHHDRKVYLIDGRDPPNFLSCPREKNYKISRHFKRFFLFFFVLSHEFPSFFLFSQFKFLLIFFLMVLKLTAKHHDQKVYLIDGRNPPNFFSCLRGKSIKSIDISNAFSFFF